MSSRKNRKDAAIKTASVREETPQNPGAVATTTCLIEPPTEQAPTTPANTIVARKPLNGFVSRNDLFRAHKEAQEAHDVTPEPAPQTYECSLCHGSGVLHPLNSQGEVDYARVVPCPGKGCTVERCKKYLLTAEAARSRGVRSPEQTFDTFEEREGSKQPFNYARQLADGSAQFIWLLVFGGTGNGKSHLCNAMARESIRRGVDTRLISVADLFAALRSAMTDNHSESVMEWYKQTQFLILDDYGVQQGSDWQAARFDELMTFRYASLLPTALTTNFDLTMLPDRIRSRFGDRRLSRIAHNSATDYRPQRQSPGK